MLPINILQFWKQINHIQGGSWQAQCTGDATRDQIGDQIKASEERNHVLAIASAAVFFFCVGTKIGSSVTPIPFWLWLIPSKQSCKQDVNDTIMMSMMIQHRFMCNIVSNHHSPFARCSLLLLLLISVSKLMGPDQYPQKYTTY